ncbi:MAG TPA: hypothetical protein VLJ17_09240 [Xanthobacteraceae bacterium]|nr:hypothetical protein [Xanthobacteraceae bacterium]
MRFSIIMAPRASAATSLGLSARFIRPSRWRAAKAEIIWIDVQRLAIDATTYANA